MSTVAIVVPVYKNEISPFEAISLKQCLAILGNYPIVFICPKKMELGSFHQYYANKAEFLFFDDGNFESLTTYNQMMLSVWFYNCFIDYDYILMYQLDCFVFKDELMFWVKKGYSYIGAPWFVENSIDKSVIEFFEVGNGGFSLRNIKDCIRVLKSRKKIKSFKEFILQCKKANVTFSWIKALRRYHISYSFKNLHRNRLDNEDKMFCLAGKRIKGFTIPDAQVAAYFSFEVQPKKLFSINNNQLPFGSHAWWKYDLEFYQPIIEKFGYSLNLNNI